MLFFLAFRILSFLCNSSHQPKILGSWGNNRVPLVPLVTRCFSNQVHYHLSILIRSHRVTLTFFQKGTMFSSTSRRSSVKIHYDQLVRGWWAKPHIVWPLYGLNGITQKIHPPWALECDLIEINNLRSCPRGSQDEIILDEEGPVTTVFAGDGETEKETQRRACEHGGRDLP